MVSTSGFQPEDPSSTLGGAIGVGTTENKEVKHMERHFEYAPIRSRCSLLFSALIAQLVRASAL